MPVFSEHHVNEPLHLASLYPGQFLLREGSDPRPRSRGPSVASGAAQLVSLRILHFDLLHICSVLWVHVPVTASVRLQSGAHQQGVMATIACVKEPHRGF